MPVRAGADTEFLDIRVLHSRLRAGTAYLAGTIQEPDVRNTEPPDHSAESQARSASPQHASVAEFLHEAVSAATRHGFAIERARGSIAFRSSRGEVVVAPSDPAGPLADQNARETLLDSLSRAGLPVRRTESGFLVSEQ